MREAAHPGASAAASGWSSAPCAYVTPRLGSPDGVKRPREPRKSVETSVLPFFVSVRFSIDAFFTMNRHQAFVQADPPRRRTPSFTWSAAPFALGGSVIVWNAAPVFSIFVNG